jgi:hypothetical protein
MARPKASLYAIVSLLRDDGTYAEVGMNTRTVIGPYRSETWLNKAIRDYARGQQARVQKFAGSILSDPYTTYEINLEIKGRQYAPNKRKDKGVQPST